MIKVRNLFFICMTSVVSTNTFAMYPVHDALNRLELVLNGANTMRVYGAELQGNMIAMQSYQNQLANMASLSWNNPTQILDSLNSIDQTARQGEALTYSTTNMTKQFQSAFIPDSVKSYFEQNDKMADVVLDTSKGTLEASKEQVDKSKEMTKTSNQINQNSVKAKGLKEVMQSQVQMQAESTAQLQAMQQSLAQMQSQQATMNAYTVSKQKQEDKAVDKFINIQDPKDPEYKGNQQLAVMPHFN